MRPGPDKPLIWNRACLRDLGGLPEAVRERIADALSFARLGTMHPSARPMRGFRGGVVEIRADHAGNAYRAIYTAGLATALYVLHVFQKKSKRGIKTPRREIELIRSRLQWALELERERSHEAS